MTPIDEDVFERIKQLVLSGCSGYAACRKVGVDHMKYIKRISSDPDIVAAKASGAIKDLAKRRVTAEHYRALPHVVDVLDNGMSQTASAAKHGVSQPLVARHIAKAKDAAPPPPQPQPPTDPELQAITLLISSYAARHNLSTKQVLHLLDK